MRILAIDTALNACAACVTEDGSEVCAESVQMERGHAEALLPLLERVMSRVEASFAGLDRVAVTVGPGSYTGLRVGLAAARAVGLAADVPVVGVTTLSALLAPLAVEAREDATLVAAIDARHGAVYLQAIGPGGGLVVPPLLARLEEVAPLLAPGPVVIAGSGAAMVAGALRAAAIPASLHEGPPVPAIAWVAALGAVADPAHALPRPLYLRAPDAAPQDHARLPRR